MKRILMALAVLLVFTAQVEAAAFTHEQLDKVLAYIEQNPAASSKNAATLKLDIATLQNNFNAVMESVFAEAKFDSDEEREVMEKLFLIKDYKIFEADEGKIFLNGFGDSAAIFGVTGKDDDRFKVLTCVYTTPENQTDMTFSSLILGSFMTTVLPAVEPETFLRELAASKSGQLTRDGITFSLAKQDGLILLTAIEEGAQ